MELEILRYSSGKESTLGLLCETFEDLSNKFLCYILEDEARAVKVFGKTRLYAGRYQLELRTVGTLHTRYLKRFPKIHKGMLHLLDTPHFKWCCFHCGNKDDHTNGCPLVGDGVNNNQVKDGYLSYSAVAYERIYPPIAAAIESGAGAWVTIKDEIQGASV